MTNKQLKGVVTALAALLTVSILTNLYSLEGNKEMVKAVTAVDSYIEKTADTGQMDDFISSPEGKIFIHCVYGN